jgi:hypothetical protein
VAADLLTLVADAGPVIRFLREIGGVPADGGGAGAGLLNGTKVYVLAVIEHGTRRIRILGATVLPCCAVVVAFNPHLCGRRGPPPPQADHAVLSPD